MDSDLGKLTVAISEPVTATDTNPSMAKVRKRRAVASVILCKMMQIRYALFLSEEVLKATAR
jgi:hypothetical protein